MDGGLTEGPGCTVLAGDVGKGLCALRLHAAGGRLSRREGGFIREMNAFAEANQRGNIRAADHIRHSLAQHLDVLHDICIAEVLARVGACLHGSEAHIIYGPWVRNHLWTRDGAETHRLGRLCQAVGVSIDGLRRNRRGHCKEKHQTHHGKRQNWILHHPPPQPKARPRGPGQWREKESRKSFAAGATPIDVMDQRHQHCPRNSPATKSSPQNTQSLATRVWMVAQL